MLSLAYILLICLGLPLLAWFSKKKLDGGLVVPRLALYGEALFLQMLLLLISYGVAAAARVRLFRAPEPDARAVFLGAGVLALALVSMAIGWRFARTESRRRLAMLVPTTGAERAVWIAVSTAAGVSEEVAFRGILPILLARQTGSFALAIAISAAAFALAHLLQGWWATLFVGIFGLIFHALVWITGGLWTAIVVHILYDWIAGLTLARMFAPPKEAADASV
ncbi:MAG TPA: CPBP family intramembrane glutamic endopeptidase [Thermoanaerobaculia bacterium]|nr:CPBP family intramembrane glutamic endopeptidase [Thermoanaerobaculia bacterium]